MDEIITCPICLCIMTDAVILVPSGQSYCKACISHSLKAFPNKDPMSNKIYDHVSLTPNYTLRK